MAAALLAHALAAQPEPLRSWKVASAGVAAHAGEGVSPNSVTALKRVGLDISQHRSQPLTPELVERARAIFVMTESHRAMIELMFDSAAPKVHLLRAFMPADADPQIGDPYGGPLSVYEACRDEMVEALPSVVDYLKTLVSGPGGSPPATS